MCMGVGGISSFRFAALRWKFPFRPVGAERGDMNNGTMYLMGPSSICCFPLPNSLRILVAYSLKQRDISKIGLRGKEWSASRRLNDDT